MSIIDAVNAKLAENVNTDAALSHALAEAERMADMFADVKPVPFVVPFERFSGLPYERPLNHAC